MLLCTYTMIENVVTTCEMVIVQSILKISWKTFLSGNSVVFVTNCEMVFALMINYFYLAFVSKNEVFQQKYGQVMYTGKLCTDELFIMEQGTIPPMTCIRCRTLRFDSTRLSFNKNWRYCFIDWKWKIYFVRVWKWNEWAQRTSVIFTRGHLFTTNYHIGNQLSHWQPTITKTVR